MMRRLLALAAMSLVAVTGLGLTSANAATLTVTTAPDVSLFSLSACAPAMSGGAPVLGSATTGNATAGDYTQVALTGIPSACAGESIEVFVHGVAGANLASSSGFANAGSMNVSVSNYSGADVSAVVVRIGGWLFPTTWTPPAPPAPMSCVGATSSPVGTGGACTITHAGSTFWGNDGTGQGHARFSVSTAAENAIVTIDLSQPPFPGWSIGGVRTNADWIKVPDYSCTELPLVRLYANPAKGGKGVDVYLEVVENPAALQSGDVICPGP